MIRVKQLALDRVLHDQIDWSAENGFQPALEPEEVKGAHRAVELDQEVHIAAWTRVAACDGTEEIQRADAEAFDLHSVTREPSRNFLMSHACIIGQSQGQAT